MLSALITRAHRARSASINSLIPAALRGRSGGKPTFSSKARNASSFKPRSRLALSFCATSWNLGGCSHSIPDADAIVRIAALGHGRHIRQIADTLGRAHPERPQQSCLDRRQRGAKRVEHHLDVTRQQVGRRGACALIGILWSGKSVRKSMPISASYRAVSGPGFRVCRSTRSQGTAVDPRSGAPDRKPLPSPAPRRPGDGWCKLPDPKTA